jgi:hypothetical protein
MDTPGVVWIRGYRPQSKVQWWPTSLALSPGADPVLVNVRDLSVDLQFTTDEFVRLLDRFEHAGLDLLLMNNPIPDTLTLAGLSGASEHRALLSNGLVARFDLPHAGEVAVLSSPDGELLEHWVRGPLQDWVLK